MAARGNLLFFAGLAFVLTAVGLGYLFLVAGEEMAAPIPAAPPLAADVPTLVSTQGGVEVRLQGGEWHTAASNLPLAPGAQVRTATDGRAEVVYGDTLRLELTESSEVRFAELAQGIAKFVMGEGLMLADVRPRSGRGVQVRSRDGSAIAETRDGTVYFAADTSGALRTAVTRGTATVSAHGETVTVQPGYFTVATPNDAPTAPAAIPRSLLLKVRWPADTSTAKRRQTVSGTTAPGARVRVGENVVWTDAKGRFSTIVDLKEGRNRIHVRVVDFVGREQQDTSPEIELDTRGPPQNIETSPDMWQRDG